MTSFRFHDATVRLCLHMNHFHGMIEMNPSDPRIEYPMILQWETLYDYIGILTDQIFY